MRAKEADDTFQDVLDVCAAHFLDGQERKKPASDHSFNVQSIFAGEAQMVCRFLRDKNRHH